jgi:Protein of unknown function (DUF2934)
MDMGYRSAPDPYWLDHSRSEIDKRVTPEERHRRIAEVAYCTAVQRGFTPGHELSDWLAAEKEADRWCGLVEPSSQLDQRPGTHE